MNFHLSIVTPSGKIFDDKVSSLRAPGLEGGFGVLAQHAPMVIALKEGVLKLIQNQSESYFSIASGILEVNHEHNVLILSDSAAPAESFELPAKNEKEERNS